MKSVIALRFDQQPRARVAGTTRRFGTFVAPVVLALTACSGCNSGVQTNTTENKVHSTQNFSAAQLNAPLSSQAKGSGAQVAPPPTR